MALERTLVCFFKFKIIILWGLFQILFVAAAYTKTNAISRAREAAVNRNALALYA